MTLPSMSMHMMCAAAAPAATNFIFLPLMPSMRYGSGKFGYAACRASSSCNRDHSAFQLHCNGSCAGMLHVAEQSWTLPLRGHNALRQVGSETDSRWHRECRDKHRQYGCGRTAASLSFFFLVRKVACLPTCNAHSQHQAGVPAGCRCERMLPACLNVPRLAQPSQPRCGAARVLQDITGSYLQQYAGLHSDCCTRNAPQRSLCHQRRGARHLTRCQSPRPLPS